MKDWDYSEKKGKVDLIVLGGGMAACALAAQAAKAGFKTALVERRGCLGHEFTATGRATVKNGSAGGDLPFLSGSLRKYLLVSQTEKGNVPLLFSTAAGVGINNLRATGVVIANAFGLQYLEGRAIVDATGTGLLPRLLGAPLEKSLTGTAAYTFEMENVGYYLPEDASVPKDFGLLDNRVSFRHDVKNRTVLAELRFAFEFSQHTRNESSVVWNRAKLLAGRLAAWLRANNEQFSEAKLSSLPPEAQLFYDRADAAFSQGTESLQGLENVFLMPTPGLLSTRDLENLDLEAEELVEQVASCLKWGDAGENEVLPQKLCLGQTCLEAKDYTLSEFEDRGMDVALKKLTVDFNRIGSRIKAGALVAGAGTSGMMALKALYDNRVPTVLIELNSEAGGTHVPGGVTSYWHGYQKGINDEAAKRVKELSEALGTGGKALERWANTLYQQELMAPHSEDCYFGTVLCGVVGEGRHIKGAVAADQEGLFVIEAQVSIDATGDGVLAFHGELPYAFGDKRDGSVQSYSQFGRESWSMKAFSDNRYSADYDCIKNDLYSELLRGHYLGHLHNSDHDFSVFPTARESRRIIGEYVLTMEDILQGAIPQDVAWVAKTPFDAHGLGSNIFTYMDLCICREELEARIPYRCFIPAGSEGLLVTGKSFSGTRDAVCICRMNPDLRNAGYAVGLAAADAVLNRRGVRDIDLAGLQEKLKKAGVLPDWTFKPQEDINWSLPFDRINSMRALLEPVKSAREQLGAASSEAEENRFERELARGWFGQKESVEYICREAEKLVEKGLPEKDEPEYAKLLKAITLLVKAGDARNEKTLVYLLTKAHAGGEITHRPSTYYRSRIDGRRVPNYLLLRALSLACERIPGTDQARELERLLEEEHLKGYITKDKYHLPRDFFCSYLELSLARAALRSGSPAGAKRLAAYLEDVRPLLFQPALSELKGATGQDFGYDKKAWEAWLDTNALLKSRSPLPLEEVFEDFALLFNKF